MPRLFRLILTAGIAFPALLMAGSACTPRQVPARGEPIRVGQLKNEELSLREIPLERYIAGVLEKEVRGNWPLEALKAQAVAARTYALYRKTKPRDAQFDVLSDTTDQVFESDENHSPAIVRAVLETEGETLQADGRIFQAFFHGCCGGHSERADQVWPGRFPEPLLQIHDDPYCAQCPSAHWTYRISRDDLRNLLQANEIPAPKDFNLDIVSREESGRVDTIRVSSRSRKSVALPGTVFRQAVGNINLKSTLFDVREEEDDFVFDGRGAGHGVGLCQWGAKGMAELRKTYREILNFYYPGAEIVGISADIEDKIIKDLEKSE